MNTANNGPEAPRDRIQHAIERDKANTDAFSAIVEEAIKKAEEMLAKARTLKEENERLRSELNSTQASAAKLGAHLETKNSALSPKLMDWRARVSKLALPVAAFAVVGLIWTLFFHGSIPAGLKYEDVFKATTQALDTNPTVNKIADGVEKLVSVASAKADTAPPSQAATSVPEPQQQPAAEPAEPIPAPYIADMTEARERLQTARTHCKTRTFSEESNGSDMQWFVSANQYAFKAFIASCDAQARKFSVQLPPPSVQPVMARPDMWRYGGRPVGQRYRCGNRTCEVRPAPPRSGCVYVPRVPGAPGGGWKCPRNR